MSPRAGWLALAIFLPAAGAAWAASGARDAASISETVLTLEWGKGTGQAGYYNRRVPGFDDFVARGPQSFLPLPDGRFVVADTWNDRLLLFDAGGKLAKTVSPPVLKMPWLLARSPGGDIYVSLARSQHIVRLNASFEVVAAFGGLGDKPGQFAQLAVMRVDRAGRLCCGDLFRSSIQVLDSAGRFLAKLSWQTTGLCVGPDDMILDLEFEAAKGYAVRARRSSAETRYLFSLPPGAVEGGRILGIDRLQNVYVSFSRSDTPGWMYLAKFDSRGRFSEDLGKLPLVPADGQVAVSDDGSMMWLEYDADAAPAGKVRVRKRQSRD